jgi:hypothetical protein
MPIAARTASRPASITSRMPPGEAASSSVRRTARSVAWAIASAAGPVSGASVPASAARSGRAAIPAAASAAAAGCARPSKGTPSGGQQRGSWHRYDQYRPSSTRSTSRTVRPAAREAARSDSATGVTRVPGPYPAAMTVLIRRFLNTATACSAISCDAAVSGGSGRS